MVYIYSKYSELKKYLVKPLTIKEIEEVIQDLGLDLKGISDDKDPILKIELTSEKLELTSPVSLARAFNYYKGFIKDIPHYKIKKSDYVLKVHDEVNNVRPKIVSAVIKDFPINEENLNLIIELQEMIHKTFGRDRKKGAIGIYPLDKIKFPIHYRAFEPNKIKFKPLNFDKDLTGLEILELHETGKKYAHLLNENDKFPLLLDDDNNVLSMPPIINSENVGKVKTTNKDLFIECTGFNIVTLDAILKTLITTLLEIGGTAYEVKVIYDEKRNDIYYLDLDNYYYDISLNKLNNLIGLNLSIDEIKEILPKMIFNLDKVEKLNNDYKLNLEIPVFRNDIWNDVDIIDDIARAYGYNKIPSELPDVSSIGEKLDLTKFREDINKQMIGLGFIELYTYLLSSKSLHIDNMNLSENDEETKVIFIENSEEQGINLIRKIILPDNLEFLRRNKKYKYPQKVFENGWVIVPDENSENKAKDELHLSVSIADLKSNYTFIKEILDTLSKINNFKYTLKRVKKPYLIEGRCAEIYLDNGEKVGFIGELNPEILSNFNLLVPVSSLELDLSKIFERLNSKNK